MTKQRINTKGLIITIILLFLFMWYLHSQGERRQRIIDAKIYMGIEREEERSEARRVDNLIYNHYKDALMN